MDRGCFFTSKSWFDGKYERAFGLVLGRVVREGEPKQNIVANSNVTVRFEKGRDAKVYCYAYGYNAALRALYSLEQDDMVLCIGEVVTKPFTRKGIQRTRMEMNCKLVLPVDLIGIMLELCSSPTIQKVLAEDFEEDFGAGFREEYYQHRIEREKELQNAARRAKEREKQQNR